MDTGDTRPEPVHETISGFVESAGQLTAFAAERGADPLARRTIAAGIWGCPTVP